MTPDLSPNEREQLAGLLQSRRRDPASFCAVVQPDGLVRLSGPRGTAFYPREGWITRFARHLDKSFFDAAVPPPSGLRSDRKSATESVPRN